MEVNQIYEALAVNLQDGLNAISRYLKFEIKTSYNYQEPSKEMSVIKGVMNFSNNDVAPVENLDAYTIPAIVSFTCVKEYANEVKAILMKYVADIRGQIQSAGDYLTVGTYTTPSESEIQMIGQIGEGMKITMFIEYTAYKGLLITNGMTVRLDGEQLLFNEFGISKQKACDSDSLDNYQTVQSIPLVQALTFSFNAFILSSMTALLEDILSLVKLETKHNLSITINGKTGEYKVIMTDAEVKGVVGGAMYAALTFAVSESEEVSG